VPVIEAVTVSVAVIVCGPTVFSVAENVPTPLVSPTSFAGNIAAPSVLLKFTVPPYVATVLFAASFAVTVKLNAVPAVAVAGADTRKCVAVAVPVPVPESGMLCWLPLAGESSVTVRNPEKRTALVGSNVTLIVQVEPGCPVGAS
jgi:hypothetical protein